MIRYTHSALIATAVLLLPPWSAGWAQPSELSTCVTTTPPDCGIDVLEVFDSCSRRSFRTYLGRAAWFPLQYLAPITIEIEGRQVYGNDFPVYVEIVPLTEPPPATFCYDGHPGYVVGIFRGGGLYCGDSGWERFGPVPLDAYVPIGGLYALQLTWFATQDHSGSPAIDCIHVLAGTPPRSGVVGRTWGNVKTLYR